MSRIVRAFERRFRELLGELQARERDRGVRWLFDHESKAAQSTGETLSHALTEANIDLAAKLHRFRRRTGRESPLAGKPLICDAGLGGLARWLRAAGFDTRWMQDVDDGHLVAEAERTGSVVVTTDSMLLDRRPIVQGRVPALWVPPSLRKLEQLRLVRAELGLTDDDSRCMRCGGELLEVDKEAVRERIPPRTLLWVDQYFECSRCGQLFWHGTHWRSINRRLAALKPATTPRLRPPRGRLNSRALQIPQTTQPQNHSRSASDDPKGIAPHSPGLRGSSYPGSSPPVSQLQRSCAPL